MSLESKKCLEQHYNNKKSVHRITKLLRGLQNTVSKACWGLPQTAACARSLWRSWAPPSGDSWRRAASRCIAALLTLDLRSLCRPVGTHRAITQAIRLTVNHMEVVPQPCQMQGGCHWENTVGNGFKSPVWVRVQATARSNHDKSSVTLQPPCCPPSIFVTSCKPVKVPQSASAASSDAQIKPTLSLIIKTQTSNFQSLVLSFTKMHVCRADAWLRRRSDEK